MNWRYYLIKWLAREDLIILNADFGNVNSSKNQVYSYAPSPEAVIRPAYANRGGMICGCYIDFTTFNLFDPSERFPQPVWAWWLK